MAEIITPTDGPDKAPRRTIARRLRYEVLRRDNYACRYCGGAAPDVKLTVDHVIPVVLGGTDDPSNLVTACADCNGGKTSSSPDAPLVADVAADAVRWARAMKLIAASYEDEYEDRKAQQEEFDDIWIGWTYGSNGRQHEVPRDDGWRNSVDTWIRLGLTMPLLEECVGIAMQRKGVPPHKTWRYFCGVAWSRLAELQKHTRDVLILADDIEREGGFR